MALICTKIFTYAEPMHKKHKEQYLFTLVNARRKKTTSFL